MPKKNKIYLDYAATTPVDKRVLKSMLPYFNLKFGNTGSLHSFGREAKEALEKSREIAAEALKAKAEEIIFTSSATESNNMVLKGIAFANQKRGKPFGLPQDKHIIISAIEHSCIMSASNWLKKQGFEITKVPVKKDGMIDLDKLKKSIKKNTILVSVMHANNEIGTIQPIKEIGRICRQKNIYFHTDAAQTFGKIPIDVDKLNVDLLTASAHKIYGPKGAALLYTRKRVKIEPLLHGGEQEYNLRASTINVPAIVGFAKAIELCQKEMMKENKRLIVLRDKLIKGILKQITDSYLNGHIKQRLNNNINIRFSRIEGESIVMMLDSYGIAVSTGSACSSHNLKPSHVLLAIGLSPKDAHGSVRISLGRWTKEKDIDYFLKVLPGIIEKLRRISPFKK